MCQFGFKWLFLKSFQFEYRYIMLYQKCNALSTEDLTTRHSITI